MAQAEQTCFDADVDRKVSKSGVFNQIDAKLQQKCLSPCKSGTVNCCGCDHRIRLGQVHLTSRGLSITAVF